MTKYAVLSGILLHHQKMEKPGYQEITWVSYFVWIYSYSAYIPTIRIIRLLFSLLPVISGKVLLNEINLLLIYDPL